MKKIFTLLLALLPATAFAADPWLEIPGKAGPGKGKKIVLVSGDEEYRSEESVAMFAKILSQHHGFDCRAVFAIDAELGTINSNNQNNIPGLEALKDADLMIIGTRFRQLPDAQLQHIADYINAGKPVIGFRTATHAFTGKGEVDGLVFKDFGLNILGERWVNHHGKHKKEGARGVIEPGKGEHPILNSVRDVFGPSDVYGVIHLTESDNVLMRGAVTETLEKDSKALDGPKNDPMMALAWTRTYTAPSGKKGRAFCTTMGASVDFLSEDLRRLIVNAAYHLTGLKVPQRANVDYVDGYDPSFYGFIREEGYWQKLGLTPAKLGLGHDIERHDPPAGTPEWNSR
ncbi:MAG: ThuA domain-containing protein [Planctomycetota bacterium]|jgi:type 1 glutamine amidotransferase